MDDFNGYVFTYKIGAMRLRVLIACEESQVVCKAFRELGHEAYSCDLQKSSGGHPEWHIKGDAIGVAMAREWDLVISFPPCTNLAASGARWFEQKRLSGEQEKSIRFFIEIWSLSHVVENPIGILNGGKYLKKHFPYYYEWFTNLGFFDSKPQIIQPWQFGHGETKATCLWLKNLPLLQPTNIVEGREQRIWKMAPGTERAKERSKTYSGIAKAMATQWSEYILNQKKVA